MNFEGMTHCERVRWWLEQHGEIDPLTAWIELGIYRLGARIHDLRRRGLNIVSLRKKVCNQFGEVCEVAMYRLENAAETRTEARREDFVGEAIPHVRVGKESRQEALN